MYLLVTVLGLLLSLIADCAFADPSIEIKRMLSCRPEKEVSPTKDFAAETKLNYSPGVARRVQLFVNSEPIAVCDYTKDKVSNQVCEGSYPDTIYPDVVVWGKWACVQAVYTDETGRRIVVKGLTEVKDGLYCHESPPGSAVSDCPDIKNCNDYVGDGICGTGNNSCVKGCSKDLADTSTDYKWECLGAVGGKNAQCSLPKPPTPIDGKCANTINSCSVGTYSDLPDTSTQYKWQCSGLNGGQSVQCLLPISPTPIDGKCASTLNSCSVGTYSDLPDTSTQYKWQCSGTNGGEADQCSLRKMSSPTPPNSPPINGKCAISLNSCSEGTYNDLRDTATNYRWQCVGTITGSSVNCSLPKPVVNGKCGTVINSCIAGTTHDRGDSSTSYKWECLGIGRGHKAMCSLPKPVVNGKCGITINSCIAGTTHDRGDSSTSYKWECLGIGRGHKEKCSLPKK